MSWHAWTSLGMVGLLTALLALTTLPADIVLIGGLTVLLVMGVVTPTDALSGLSNPSMVTIGVLYVVVTGLRQTGAIAIIGERLLGRPRSISGAQVRLMTPVIALSAFVSNTPVVALLIPAVLDWAKRYRLSVSKLLIPLSYASILGGTCTLIGTSTNLVVNSLLVEQAGQQPLGMFDIAWVGLPAAVLGFGFVLLVSRKLLPDRRPPISQADDPREYTTEMLVPPSSPLVGKTLEEAGLRHLPGAYIAEIERDGQVTVAVSSEERLRANDRLVFVGVVESVVDLRKSRGLLPATDQVFKLDSARS
ncbi:MAG: SLC13 family permease, partial [Phycisphaerae bacterium]